MPAGAGQARAYPQSARDVTTPVGNCLAGGRYALAAANLNDP